MPENGLFKRKHVSCCMLQCAQNMNTGKRNIFVKAHNLYSITNHPYTWTLLGVLATNYYPQGLTIETRRKVHIYGWSVILYKLCAFVGVSGWRITMHGVNNIKFKTSNQLQFKSQQEGASKSVCNSKHCQINCILRKMMA